MKWIQEKCKYTLAKKKGTLGSEHLFPKARGRMCGSAACSQWERWGVRKRMHDGWKEAIKQTVERGGNRGRMRGRVKRPARPQKALCVYALLLFLCCRAWASVAAGRLSDYLSSVVNLWCFVAWTQVAQDTWMTCTQRKIGALFWN